MAARILQLILYRIVFTSMVLIYQLLALVMEDFPILPFKAVLVVTCLITLLSAVYYWYLRYKYNDEDTSGNFVLVQFVVDIFTISVMVVLTGGLGSNLRFTYLMVILVSAVYLEKIAIYAITILSLSFYFLALNFAPLVYGSPADPWFSLFKVTPWIQTSILGQFVLCFITALLSGFMQSTYRSSRKMQDLQERRIRSLRVIRKKIVESLPSGLITCDMDGSINFVNHMGKRLLQCNIDELLGQDAWRLFGLQEHLDNDMTDSISRVESTIAIGGVSRIFGISHSPIDFETGRHGHLLVFQDLTKIKMLEQHKLFEDRMSAIGKMAAGVAHEIRNPLAAISGSIQVLKEFIPPDETAVELADIVTRETRRLDDIISQFLAYTRPGSPPDFRPLDLVVTVKDFIALTQNDARMTNLDVVFQYEGQSHYILGDQSKLNQVFWNLLRNSVNAGEPDGRIEISLSVEGEWVSFILRDYGIGMTPEQQEHLFTPFQSFSKTGSGLGMSIVYEIMQMHKGRIEVWSEVGDGTRITLIFPKYQE